jgi:hypothetical protein
MLIISVAKLATTTFALNITRLVAITFTIAIIATPFKLVCKNAYKGSKVSIATSAI